MSGSVGVKMEEIINKLKNAPEQDEYVSYLYDLLENCSINDPKQFFPYAFLFIEKHKYSDIGNPGPLVHFIEKFYPQYINDLCTSIERIPTYYTLWMVNRILNGNPDTSVKEKLITTLMNSLEHPKISEELKDEVNEYLLFQKA